MSNQFDVGAVRRAFARAAPHYTRFATLQREVESRLLEQLDAEPAAFAPHVVLDVGTGPGRAAAALRKRYPRSLTIALDHALPMLTTARKGSHWWRPLRLLAGDAAALPLRDDSVDFLFSNLCLQWQTDLPRVFDEWRRVLRAGGVVLASTFGRDTLIELRDAFAIADAGYRDMHINAFDDIARIGDALLAAGFRNPVLERETFVLDYPDVPTLMRELRGLGAGNALAARRRALTGKTRMQGVFAAYETLRRNGTLPATWEVVTLRALAPDAGAPRREGQGVVASVPLDQIPIRRRVM